MPDDIEYPEFSQCVRNHSRIFGLQVINAGLIRNGDGDPLSRPLQLVREIAVRTALGAGRGRVASQLLAESLLLSLSGGALGLLVGTLAIRALMAMRPGHIPRIKGSVALNTPVLL